MLILPHQESACCLSWLLWEGLRGALLPLPGEVSCKVPYKLSCTVPYKLSYKLLDQWQGELLGHMPHPFAH